MADLLLSLITIEFFVTIIRMGTPIALSAIGEVYSERSGVLNVGVEGIMLIGAFFAVLGTSISQKPFVGILTGVFASLLISLIYGVIVITLKANQIVTGFALNIAMLGITEFFYRVFFGIRHLPVKVPAINTWNVPILSKIPIVGPILFQNNYIVYLIFFLTPILQYVLFKTTIGLKIRSVGENPRAADMVGIKVNFWRYMTTLINGLLCGIAGAAVSLGTVGTFVPGIIAGRGFIALAAVIFGRWNPIGAVLAALLFGAAQALALRFQAFNIGLPSEFVLMLPYILSLIGIILFRGSGASPAALTKPYDKDGFGLN